MTTMGKQFLARLLLAGVLVFGLAASAFAADPVLEKAKQLMAKGDAQAAYTLLAPLEAERAGDLEYDYLLGSAALDAGKPTQAVFALERVLAVNPDHAQARAQIARAYFMLGETQTSKQEFETVKKQDVPPDVAATIQKFLDAIQRAAISDRTTVTGYVEATVGYDSNVNSATGGNQIALPVFGGAIFTLSSTAVEQSDSFFSVGGGLSVRHPFNREVALLAGADVNKRVNSSEDRFDTGFGSGNIGLSITKGKNNFLVAFQDQQFYVDNNRFRDAYGFIGQWQYSPNDQNSYSVYLQHTRLDYPGQDIRNADRTVGGVAVGHAFSGANAPVIYAGAYLGKEAERASGVPHLGHDLWGLRVGGQLRLGEKTTLFASANYEQRDYGGADPLFLVTRDDKQSDFRVGVSYRPYQGWTVSPQISYVRNDSNIIINDFDRTIFSVTVRRDFN